MRDLPEGFELVSEGRLQVAVRSSVRDAVLPLMRSWAAQSLPPGRPLPGGRGGVAAFDLGGALAVVLRHNRRGGLLRHFNHDLYFGRPRPFREIRTAETLRARGVSTVEILAAAVRWSGIGCYRGAVASREIPAAVNLWEYVRAVPAAERVRACSVTAAVTRQLHDAGAVHPDLNLQNYLVGRGETGPKVWIIDCDPVRIIRVSAARRRAAFARLLRSVRRLDPEASVLTPACIDALRQIADPGRTRPPNAEERRPAACD